MKLCKRIVAAIVMMAMLAVCIPALAFTMPEYPEVPEGYDGYVTFAVSALTLGWTYIIDPVLVPVHEGETFDVVTVRAFEMLDWAYDASQTEYGFSLNGIGCYETEPNVPEYLMNEILAYPAWAEENFGYAFGEWTGEYDDDEILSAYEYCTLSGWMYSENNVVPDVGADGCVVTVGNVYTWFFTIYGWGMDYGVSDGWGSFPLFDNPMEGVDRTEASEAMALLCADEELIENVVENAAEELFAFYDYFYWPESSQEEIDGFLEALFAAIGMGDPEIVMGDVNMDGEVGVDDALIVLRCALGVQELDEEALAYADMNGDGVVNAVDALVVLRLALGIA